MGHSRKSEQTDGILKRSVKFWTTWNRFFNPIKTIKWAILHRFHPKHRYHVLDTGLDPGYYDPDTQILYATMEAVRRFVDDTEGVIDWQWREDHQQAYQQLIEVYNWWVYEYPGFEQASDRLHERWARCLTNDKIFPLTYKDDMEETANELLERITVLEAREQAECRAMLIKVAEVRPFLWYP